MADESAPEVGITIKATDKTGPGFASASKGASDLEKKFNGVGGAVRQMPQQFSRASGAISSMGGAFGKMGGAAGMAVGKLTGMASLLVGGPLGVGIAAVTLAIGAMTVVWDTFQTEAKESEKAIVQMSAAMDRMHTSVQNQKDALADLTDEVEHYGMTADQRMIEKGEERLQIIDQELEANARLINAMIKRRRSVEGLNVEDEVQLQKLFETNAAMREVAQTITATNEALQEKMTLAFAEDEGKLKREKTDKRIAEAQRRDEKAKAEAEKAAIDLARQRIDYVKEASEREHAATAKRIEDQMALEREAYEARLKLEDQEAEEKEQRAQAVASTISDVSSQLTTDLLSNDERTRKSAVRTAASAAMASIGTAAAKGAADVFASSQKLGPILGPIIGAIAAAAVFGSIMTFRSKVIGAASGGLIRGGVAGRDSVPAMLMPGEIVMPTPVAQQFQRMAAGRGGGGGTSMNTTVNHYNVGIQALDVSSVSESQLSKVALRLGEKQEIHRSRGRLKPR